MNVIARISHANAIAFAFLQVESGSRCHLVSRIGYAVDRPLIESFNRGVLLFEEHVKDLVGLLRAAGARIAEMRVVPFERLRWKPLRLAFVTGVLDHGAHAVMAIVVGKVSHDPNAGVVHLHGG